MSVVHGIAAQYAARLRPRAMIYGVSFWSADWTPWRAHAAIQARFPGLQLDIQPHYDRA